MHPSLGALKSEYKAKGMEGAASTRRGYFAEPVPCSLTSASALLKRPSVAKKCPSAVWLEFHYTRKVGRCGGHLRRGGDPEQGLHAPSLFSLLGTEG